MWQQWDNGVLDARPERAVFLERSCKGFLAVPNQKLVQIGIGMDYRQLPELLGEADIIDGRSIFDVVAKVLAKFRANMFAKMRS